MKLLLFSLILCFSFLTFAQQDDTSGRSDTPAQTQAASTLPGQDCNMCAAFTSKVERHQNTTPSSDETECYGVPEGGTCIKRERRESTTGSGPARK